MAGRLPPNARRSVLEGLATGADAYGLFQALGKTYGVRDIRVDGDYGLIEGSIADCGIMAGYAKHKHWAVETNRLFAAFFAKHRRGTYIDIGANLGLTTIPIAKFADVRCKAFEPEPLNFRYLERNVAAHCGQGNVALFNVALYDRQGTVDFELDVNNHGDHRIHVPGANGAFDEQNRPIISVRAERLDDLFDPQRIERPLVVKLDTQGSEGRIFLGGQATIAVADVVFFEYWPYSMKRTGVDNRFLVDFIQRSFASGSMVPGDQDCAPDWQPIGDVVGRMEAAMAHADREPFTYHEIYLQK